MVHPTNDTMSDQTWLDDFFLENQKNLSLSTLVFHLSIYIPSTVHFVHK
jgi:hypothetical protein